MSTVCPTHASYACFLMIDSICGRLLHFPFSNPSPNDKILDCAKFKAFADYKLNLREIINLV